jgi:hypothetical protein
MPEEWVRANQFGNARQLSKNYNLARDVSFAGSRIRLR